MGKFRVRRRKPRDSTETLCKKHGTAKFFGVYYSNAFLSDSKVYSEHHEPKIVTRYGWDTRLLSFERYGDTETSGAFYDRSLNNWLCRCLARDFLGRPLPDLHHRRVKFRAGGRQLAAGLAKAVAAGGDF